ncbi:hypothetical protein [Pontibacter roseus]|uniref:hypothetical protein n=1 Tax=Pontibacter roseus TaxID=336989 RepID=UPI00036D75AC|nr:hypothetical protein [Pontibacter roseus]
MHRFTTYIALFLLLLFVRAMVPDQLLLSLHSHAHTEHSHPGDHNQAHVDKKHTHCPVEDLFGAPFQNSSAVVSFTEPILLKEHVASYYSSWKSISASHTQQRGPPAVA